MARTHPHTTRFPTPLWAAIIVESARRRTTPSSLIRFTMDAEVRKTQGDYTQWFERTQTATEDDPREGFLDRVSQRLAWTIAVTSRHALELLHALRRST